DVLEGEGDVQGGGVGEDSGGAAHQDRPQPTAVAHPAGEVEERSHCGPERDFVHTGPSNSTGDAEALRAARLLRADRGEGVGGVGDDLECGEQRLDVVDAGGPAEDTGLDREGRLLPRLAAVTFDRGEESGLLSAYVGARPPSHLE